VANLTLSIDDDLLRQARIRALEQGTSVNAVVRDYLRDYAGRRTAASAIESFLALADEIHASSGAAGRTWTREELYDRWDRPPRV
jgi:plasmid stability protein